MALFRSLLFTPANDRRKAEKVFQVGADVAILDLEDAVALSRKEAARAGLAHDLDSSPLIANRRIPVYVRVNALSTEFAFEDIQAVVRPQLDGIVLPKTQSAADVRIADYLISQIEFQRRMEPGRIDLMPLLETGAGIANAREIVRASRRVRRIAFGAGDYSADIGATWTAHESELLYARSVLVIESRAGGLEPPIDTPCADFRNIETFEREAARGRELGFQGKLLIHPNQVGPANGIFSPAAAEIAWAEKAAAAFDEAEARGIASIEVDGRLVDYAGGSLARGIRARAREIREREAAGGKA